MPHKVIAYWDVFQMKKKHKKTEFDIPYLNIVAVMPYRSL